MLLLFSYILLCCLFSPIQKDIRRAIREAMWGVLQRGERGLKLLPPS